jgi:PKD repeat protein
MKIVQITTSKLRSLIVANLIALLTLLSVLVANAGDYVLVVDTSGSMNGRISAKDNRIRIAVVQNALREYLPALPWPSRVYLIAFNTGIVSQQEVSLNSQKDVEEALAWVNGLKRYAESGEHTHLWTTLRRGLQIASNYSRENSGQPVIVRVLTDGEDNERVTSLDKVLREFPLVDGEHIRGNLILLGDLEIKTKLTLPDGAFETTKNIHWSDLFPPIVLCFPAQPKTGDEVRLVENSRSIYAGYEWLIDNKPVGNDKILSWRFPEARVYRVMLKVKGLDGGLNSSAVLVQVSEQEAFTVELLNAQTTAQPGEDVRLVARPSSPASRFDWFVDSVLAGTNQDFLWHPIKERNSEIKLVARSADGRVSINTCTIVVKELPLTVRIKGPKQAIAGQPVQFAGEISGPAGQVEWRFGDGATSTDKNPIHTFGAENQSNKNFQVFLRATSPGGRVVEAGPHLIGVQSPTTIKPPKAAFRIIEQNVRVGDILHLVDESDGYLESWRWEATGESDSSDKSPIIQLTTAGRKIIRLKIKGPGGADETSKQITVQPRYEPVLFKTAASKNSGAAPLAVQFTNHTTGEIKGVLWEFGDGYSSTNRKPQHEFVASSNYVVVATAFPADPNQSPVKESIVVKVARPLPIWAKAMAFAAGLCGLTGTGIFLLRRLQRNKLRLAVFWWPEQATVCRRADLSTPDEAEDLKPDVPLRIRRVGKTQNLLAEALDGACILASDGQETTSQNIGQGARLVVKAASGVEKAVAIAVNQKPRRPSPVVSEIVSTSLGVKSSPTSAAPSGDFDWGWESAANTRKH